jgi:hypothetical protein
MGIWPISIYPITVNDWTMRGSGNAGNESFVSRYFTVPISARTDCFLSFYEIGEVTVLGFLYW